MEPFPIQAILCPEYASNVQLNDDQRLNLYQSLTGSFVGLMPPDQLIDHVFPGAQYLEDGDKVSGSYKTFKKSKKEVEMYEPWAKAMKQELLPPGTEITISAERTNQLWKLKPDHGIQVPVPEPPPKQQAARRSHRKPKPPAVRISERAFDFMEMDLTVEGKLDEKNMPFLLVRISGALVEAKDGGSARGQLGLYAERHMAHQHRVAVYQVILCPNAAQILRWDRAGVVVTDSFDPTVEPWIPRLVRSYYQMDRRGRGFDITVQPATVGESLHFRSTVASYLLRVKRASENRTRLANNLAISQEWPVEKVAVPDDNAPAKIRYVLTSQPFYISYGPVGYGTRLYLAVSTDVINPEVHIMRDSWRVEGTISEYETYRRLFKAEVPNTYQVACGGDVVEPGRDGPQKTTSQEFATSPEHSSWRLPCNGPPQMHARVHQRHLEPVGFPVDQVKSCRELLMVLRDGLQAVKHAWESLGLLHGDITPTSLMFVLKSGGGAQGVLTGWQNAHYYGKRPAYYATTEQFMSLRLSKYPCSTPDLMDEVESWFWTFVYCAAVYVGAKNEGLLLQQGDFFNTKGEKVAADGGLVSTIYQNKESALRHELPLVEFDCAPFTDVFQVFVRGWRTYYSCIEIPEVHNDAFHTVASQLADPQWYLNHIEKALKRLDWGECGDVRGKPTNQLSTKDQQFVSDYLRARTVPPPNGQQTPPTIHTADGKTTQNYRVPRKMGSIVFAGKKRPAEDDLRAPSDKENLGPYVHPTVLSAPKSTPSPDEIARRARNLKRPQLRLQNRALPPPPIAPPASDGSILAVTVLDSSDVPMATVSGTPAASASDLQNILQPISAPQTPKQKKRTLMQKVQDVMSPKKTKDWLPPAETKWPRPGLVRGMKRKGK